jgi:DNA-binding IclR family transcriptional regulator
VLSANTLAGFAQPLLERLVAETQRAVVAGIRARLPAHLPTTGRAMLAALSEAQLRALYPSVGALVTHAGPGNCECVHGTEPAHPRQDLIEWPSISCSNSS